MITTTLSSKGRFKNLLMGMLRKNTPIALYLSAILFLFFPLQMIMDTMNAAEIMAYSSANYRSIDFLIAGIYTEVSVIMVVGILILSAFIMALVQSSYLHSKRAVDLYHSLPVTRTQLMSANLLAAFLTVMVPFILNYILNIFALIYRQSVLGSFAQAISPYFVFWDIFGWCVVVFAIMAVVMLVSTQVGSVFENFIFAGELLAAPLAIIMINELLCEEFLAGYVSKMNYKFITASSPVSLMVAFYAEVSHELGGVSFFFIVTVLAWLALGVAIFAAALYLGRRRRSELAESPGCKGIIGNVLTVTAVYIGGIAAGSILYSTLNTAGELAYLISVIIGAVLVFFFMEAVLNRGFAGIRKTLPFGALCCAVVFLATFVVTSGGLGYETRVPSTASVESVTYGYRGWYDYVTELDAETKIDRRESGESYNGNARYSYNSLGGVVLKTPEAIELMKKIQLSLVNDARDIQSDEVAYYSNYRLIRYNLKNATMMRQYSMHSEATTELIRQLNEQAEFQEQTNPVLRVKSSTVEGISLHNSLGFRQYEVGISRDMGTLLEAMRQDALANGTRDYTAGSSVLGYIYVNTGGDSSENRNLTENLILNFSIPVFASSTNTIAALNSMGMEDAIGTANLSEVTEIGFNRYDNWKGGGGVMVSGIGNTADNKDGHDYLIEDVQSMKQAVDGAVRFADQGNRNYSSETYSSKYFYLTLYKRDEMGITVMVASELLPESIKTLFMVDDYGEVTAEAVTY